MDQLFNHLPPPAPVFAPAASMYQAPGLFFPVASSMPVQQVPFGEFAPATSFPSVTVHTDSNPTLYSSPSSSHPSYAQMITEAIGTLKERDGSSRQAIAKFIERKYPNLPTNHSILLTQNLKRMKDSGELAMVKHSYVLSASAPGVLANLSENLHPGRPSKLEPVKSYSQAQQAPVQESPINPSLDSGSGTVHESLFASIGLVDPAPVPKKRPGRPKKVVGPSNATSAQPVVDGDDINDANQLGITVGGGGIDGGISVKRRPGRPPRNAASLNSGTAVPVNSPRGRGRPKQSAGLYTGKPRGRPRRNPEASAPINNVSGGAEEEGDGAAVVFGRKRGRPGRPRKNAPAAVVQVSNLQQLLAYHELKSKLDFFKSRVKNAVDMLKPVLNNIQTASIANGALEELEELASVDVNVASSLHGMQFQPQDPTVVAPPHQ